MTRRALLVLLLAACGRRGEAPGCVPGAAQACACVNGWSGAQTCLADRTFEPCVCAGPARVEAPPPVVDAGPAAAIGAATPRVARPATPRVTAPRVFQRARVRDAGAAVAGEDPLLL